MSTSETIEATPAPVPPQKIAGWLIILKNANGSPVYVAEAEEQFHAHDRIDVVTSNLLRALEGARKAFGNASQRLLIDTCDRLMPHHIAGIESHLEQLADVELIAWHGKLLTGERMSISQRFVVTFSRVERVLVGSTITV